MTVESTSTLRLLKEHEQSVREELTELRRDVHADIDRVERVMGDHVPTGVYEADKRYFESQLRQLHELRREDRAKADRAWQLALTSFVAPIVVAIVVAYLMAGLGLGGRH